MQLIGLTIFSVLLYSVGMFFYLPFKLWDMAEPPSNVWTYLTRRRLLLVGLSFLIAAPVPSLAMVLAGVAGVSGGDQHLIPDWVIDLGYGFMTIWFVVAFVLFILLIKRPADSPVVEGS